MTEKELWLRGVMPAIVTPFLPDGTLHEDGLRRYVRHVLGVDGVTGILCNGYTGEGSALTPRERVRVIEICAEEIGDRMPLIAGVDAASTAEAIALGRDARQAGARAIQVNSPFQNLLRRGFLDSPEASVAFFQALNDEVGLPMTVFQYPTWSGLTYSPETMLRLSEIQNVVGVKEAVDMDTYVEDFRHLHGKVSLLADNNTYTLLGMLLLGADGTMVGVSNVGTHLYVQLFGHVEQRDYGAAVDLMNNRILPLMEVFARNLGRTTTSFVARIKEALVVLGLVDHATVRAPELPIGDAERRVVRHALEEAGLLT